MQEASDHVTRGLFIADLSAKFPHTDDYTNAIFDAINYTKAQEVNGGDVEARGFWSAIEYRMKGFSPTGPLSHPYQSLGHYSVQRRLERRKGSE